MVKPLNRNRICPVILLAVTFALMVIAPGCDGRRAPAEILTHEPGIILPAPRFDSQVSLEQSIKSRRSVREYSTQPLTLEEVSQLLWAAQGITDPAGMRTAPSAGATYPLEVYLITGNVQDLAPGIYRYVPDGHKIAPLKDGDIRAGLASVALDQDCVENGAAVFVLAAIYERTTGKYGERGVRYVHMEAGHAAQNLCLQATALGLGAVTVGAFDDGGVGSLLGLRENEQPLYIIPAGRK